MILKRTVIYTPKNQPRTLHIHLPDDYRQSGERYPVMYFFDGHNLFRNEDASFGTSWGMEEFLNRWHKPMILVGFECTHIGNERLGEYSPYTFENDYWGCIEGWGKPTMRWIIDEIKPMIDREFRTWPFREATGIGGSSMGGLMSIYAGACHNRWFSKCACVSSSLDFNFSDILRDVGAQPIDPDTRFYLSWGSHEEGGGEDYSEAGMSRRNHAVARVLEQQGGRTVLHCQQGGRHCEADWGRQIPDFMHWLWC